MAVVTLGQVWINLLSTGEAVHAYSSDRSRTTSMAGDVRQYAGGRQRPVSVDGIKGEFVCKLRDVTDEDIELLKSWYGDPVCVRDFRSRVYFGVYWSLAERERRTANLYDVDIRVQEITYVRGT